MPLEEAEGPLIWWSQHEFFFPIVTYLARTILGIPRNRIETKRVFSIIRILTSLRWCWLGAKNLDLLVLLIKNWLNDPTIRFYDKTSLANLDVFGEVEEDILDVIDFEFPNKVDDHLEECI